MYNYKLKRIYEHTEGYNDSIQITITHEKQFTNKDIETMYNEFIQESSEEDQEEYQSRYYNSVLDDFKRFLITRYGFKNIKYESAFVKDDFYY